MRPRKITSDPMTCNGWRGEIRSYWFLLGTKGGLAEACTGIAWRGNTVTGEMPWR